MDTFRKSISKNKKKIKNSLVILILLLIATGIYFYSSTFYVIIRFNELGPLTKNMSAFYNGFKIGKIVHIGADKDFKHTIVRVNLNDKNINLPQNTVVHVERFPNGELYLQFIYPQSPSLSLLKRGDVLEGIAPYSVEQFMLGQNISGMSDIVSIHVIRALNATEIANQEMENFFKNTSKLIEENSKGINAAVNNTAAMTKSLSQMAENLNQTSKKLNNALDEKSIKDAASNIRDTTSNIKDATSGIKTTTENITEATKDIDKTIKKIDATISNANATAENLNTMTSGLNETLSKRLGGMRIMFGTPIKPQANTKNACK